MHPLVVNKKTSRYDVYIGRGPPWGNPFSVAEYGREKAVALFAEMLRENAALTKRVKRELRGRLLGCHCAPSLCHGEILARVANEGATGIKKFVTDDPWKDGSGHGWTHERAMAAGCRCDICPARGKSPIVPAEIKKKPRLVIVGQEPGGLELRLGKPFLGKSGQLLDHLLQGKEGLAADEMFDFNVQRHSELREVAHVTNASMCRADGDKENEAAAVCCAPRLYHELAEVPKDIPILTLGKTAARSVLNVRSMMMARGFVWTTKEIDPAAIRALQRKADKTGNAVDRLKHELLAGRALLAGRVVLPTLHPAFILRAEIWKPVLRVDVDRFRRILSGELDPKTLTDGAPNYTVVSRKADVRQELSRLGPEVSYDIETDGVDALHCKILCIGVADKDRAVIIGPWSPMMHAEILTAQLTRHTRSAVVGHNGFGFDQPCMEKDGVVFDQKVLEDTLIGHHTYGSHFPQRLDWVVSVNLDSPPWKIRFGRRGAEEKGLAPHKMEKKELYLYNSGDVDKTIGAWHEMQGDLDTVRSVYEHDKDLARIAKMIFVNGVKVDIQRKEELSRKMAAAAFKLRSEMRKMVGDLSFSPMKTAHVRKALYEVFKAPIINRTPTGLPATDGKAMEALSHQDTAAGNFCRKVLDYRGKTKAKGTYLDPVDVDARGRAHFPTKSFGTVSGRFSGRFLTLPRLDYDKETGQLLLESRIREAYIPEEGNCFVYFDLSQAEMFLAAYLSGDENFIADMSSGDPYIRRARMFFPQAEADGMFVLEEDRKSPNYGKPTAKLGKQLRQITKSASLAANYLAEAEKIFFTMQIAGFTDVNISIISAVLDKIHTNYRGYFRYVRHNVEFCHKNGYLKSPLVGRTRWFGKYPKPNEIANYPVQSGIADIMNTRLIDLVFRRLPRKNGLPFGWKLVAQVHDACVFECRIGKRAERVAEEIRQMWAEPVIIPPSAMCKRGAEFKLGIDLKVKQRYSEL